MFLQKNCGENMKEIKHGICLSKPIKEVICPPPMLLVISIIMEYSATGITQRQYVGFPLVQMQESLYHSMPLDLHIIK